MSIARFPGRVNGTQEDYRQKKKREKCKPNNKNGLTNARNMRMIGKESIRTIPFCDMRTGMQNLRTIEFKNDRI